MSDHGRFMKRPVVIEAIRWTGENIDQLEHFVGDPVAVFNGCARIETLEGDVYASVGHWVIRGIAGEYYPCRPEMFKRTYEEVGDER